MLIELILFLVVGILFGTFTGLVPGIHINLIGVLLVSLSASAFSSVNPIFLVVFIVAMATTHTFLDFVPSILLGCPDTDTELSVLPGHELLKQGRAYEAINLTAWGSLAAVFALVLIAFPASMTIGFLQSLLDKRYVLPAILIIASSILILTESNKLRAAFVFLFTGLLGWSVLNLNISGLSQPLLPLLTGLFGGSMILISIRQKSKIPPQEISKDFSPRDLQKPVASAFLGSILASPLSSFLPGLGSGQAAVLGNLIAKTDRKGFLVLLGATNTFVMGFSFIALYVVSKTRTGAAAAINSIFGQLTPHILILMIFIFFFAGIIAFFLTSFLAKFFSKNISKISYQKISIATLFVLGLVVLFVSGIVGLAVLIVSTLAGIYCISLNVRRTQMMGCLLIPTIIFYILK